VEPAVLGRGVQREDDAALAIGIGVEDLRGGDVDEPLIA